MEKISLNGLWKMRNCNDQKFYDAEVPVSNFTVLEKYGVLKDHNVGLNEKDALQFAYYDYEFSKVFEVEKSTLESDQIMLCCDMLDTLADIFVNNNLVASTANAHIGYQFDIKKYLLVGENYILIKFASPLKYLEEKNKVDKMPHSMMCVQGAPHIRKPQCHFGWDWGPKIPIAGIIRDIYLELRNKAYIQYVDIMQEHNDNNVVLNINIDSVLLTANDQINYCVELTHPSGLKEKHITKDGKLRIEIENPELWWVKELSSKIKQPLYQLEVVLLDCSATLDTYKCNVGLRTITLDTSDDKYGRNFQFKLNNVPLFIKGANWIPMDSLPDTITKQRLEYYIRTCYNSNFNMLRVWGGGYYESEDFYDLCDEYGILVWQDFAFACAPYPFYNEEFLQNVLQEVEYNVKRIKKHPSLALWCGNNEIEAMSMGWANKTKLIKYTEIFFYDILLNEVIKYDDITPYTQGSPIGRSFNKDVGSDNVGDTHLWGVWHGLQPLNYYRNRMTRFCSEFGLESLPSMDAIRRFSDVKDYSLKSDVFMAHQKCGSGNAKMLYYMATKYNIPDNFVDLPYLTGLVQRECVMDATEHWRRNRGRCNGSMYWQLNDCWLVSSWSSIDYLGKYKALQYGATHFNNSLCVSLEDNKKAIKLFVINDTNLDKNVTLSYRLIKMDGEEILKITKEVLINPTCAKLVDTLDITKYTKKEKKDLVLVAELFRNGEMISKKSKLLTEEKNANLVKSELEYVSSVTQTELELTIRANTYTKDVMIDFLNYTLPLSDNYFDLEPNKPVVVKCPLGDRTAEELLSTLELKCVNNLDYNRSKWKNFLTRLKVALVPMNIINVIIYKFM